MSQTSLRDRILTEAVDEEQALSRIGGVETTAKQGDQPITTNLMGAQHRRPDRVDKIRHVLVCIGCIIYAACMHLAYKENLSKVWFLERDPTLSFPHVIEQVSVQALEGISIGIPIFFILLCSAALKYRLGTGACFFRGISLEIYFYLLVGLAQALLLTDAITTNVKIMVMRPRPNFFAYCNYKGYGSAMTSGNYTSYDAQTTANIIGTISSCLASTGSVDDSVLSFPSGHSSMSWAGMTFISLLLKLTISQRKRFVFASIDGVVFIAPLYLSAWVAITRIVDYYHHCDDCMMGATIGVITTFHIWKCTEALLNQHVCLAPYDDKDYFPVTNRQNDQ